MNSFPLWLIVLRVVIGLLLVLAIIGTTVLADICMRAEARKVGTALIVLIILEILALGWVIMVW